MSSRRRTQTDRDSILYIYRYINKCRYKIVEVGGAETDAAHRGRAKRGATGFGLGIVVMGAWEVCGPVVNGLSPILILRSLSLYSGAGRN